MFVSPTKPSAWAEQVRGTGEDLSNLPAARGKGRYAADCGVCCYRTARVTSHESLAEASDGDGADLHRGPSGLHDRILNKGTIYRMTQQNIWEMRRGHYI